LTPRGEVWPRIYALEQDAEGDIWLGTRGQGIFRISGSRTERFRVRQFEPDPDDPRSLGNGHIFSLHTDARGRLWIATWGGGVNYMEKDSGGNPVFYRPSGFPVGEFARIRHITSDRENQIWCASPSGVITFDGYSASEQAPRYVTLTTSGNGPLHLPVNNVNSVLNTAGNDIFIGTAGGGMYKVIRDADGVHQLQSYSSLNGFPSDIIYALTEDVDRRIWISTPRGIVRFDPSDGKADLYGNDHYDSYNLTSNTAAFAAGRDVLLGSNKGLVVFDPARMEKDTYVPPLYFTRLQLFNHEVIPGSEDRLLDKPLSATSALTFTHRQSVFNIGFAALDYRDPDKIRYQYLLDGFDREWNDAGVSRSASYTNLPAGDYTLRVRSTNSDGAWVDNEKQLAITVLPPFWKTPWAYALYVLLALALIFVTAYIMYTVYRLKHSIRVDQEMMRVFTNISHEIRTPLTLVHTPLEHILKTRKIDPETGQELQIVYRNSGRLLQLVNQLLDFRKIQHNRMPLMLHPLAVSEFLHDLVQNFQSLAEQKNINLDFRTNCPDLTIETDREKIETIFYNLISNALKYTPSGKSVYVEVFRAGKELRFVVRDEGVGIAKERMNRLFVPFESGEEGPNHIQPGTGIGLALVKELCNLLDIRIGFESQSGTGTVVQLKMAVEEASVPVPDSPEIRKAFVEGEPEYAEAPAGPLSDNQSGRGHNPSVSDTEGEENNRKKVLVVEDNQELRHYLRRILRGDYDVLEACNGKIGLQKAQEELPDLIISDLMMPETDGAALAAQLKDDIKTSHIPVMILTAKSDTKVQAQLFRIGVEAFIIKPFNSEILLTRVASILRQRERLHAVYSSSLFAVTRLKKEDSGTSPKDQEFLDRLMDYLGEHLSSSDIAVDDLCSVSGFTYSLLYKKLKTLIGLSPLEFIREFRIQRAAELIVEGRFSMKEIAYMVGFSDSRYFSRSFKQKYGVTPSEYKSAAQS
ncbi:response regulator, partial [Alistipes sp. OttesenSCG-928-L06]|nr:response regulator [Alistipes sp. OttesenSCG-928-L06]